jgi:hypothetical protein
MKIRYPTLIEGIALLFALSMQWNLLESWIDSPYERGSWLPFLIWLSPLIAYRLGMLGRPAPEQINTWLIFGGIVLLLIGSAGSVNTFKNLGFAVTLAAFIPLNRGHLLWLPAALSWMRVVGWLGSYYLGGATLAFRLLCVIPCTAWMFYVLWKEEHCCHEVTES